MHIGEYERIEKERERGREGMREREGEREKRDILAFLPHCIHRYEDLRAR